MDHSNSQPTFPIYAFLSTLVVLLCTSIVVSAILLRRRNLRAREESLRNGTWITSNNIDKPRMFEVFLASDKCIPGNGYGYANRKNDDVDWGALMPFSATYLPPHGAPLPTPSSPNIAWFEFCYPSTLLVPAGSPLTTSPPSPGQNSLCQQDIGRRSLLRATFLIAMPSSGLYEKGTDGEKTFPHAELGVVDVCLGEDASEEGDRDVSERKRSSSEGLGGGVCQG